MSTAWELFDEETRAKLLEQYPELRPVEPTRERRRRTPVVRKGNRNDLIISIHAQERMEERWPELVEDAENDDQVVARIIQGEVNDALIAGRKGTVCPIELANNSVERWHSRKGVWYCWTKDKSRGYAFREDDEGLVVLTTLVGEDKQKAQGKLRRR